MRKYLIYAILAFAAVSSLFYGCNPDDPTLSPSTKEYREALNNKTDYGLSISGKQVFEFDVHKHQLYSGNDGRVGRIQTDDGANYIEFTLKASPVQGKFIDGSLTVVGSMGDLQPQSGSQQFYIIKTGDNGDCWIWCESKKLGGVIWLK